MCAFLVPPQPFFIHSIVFKICQVKVSKRLALQGAEPEIAFWPGVHYFPSSMFWMNGDSTPYDGKHLYTTDDLTEDLAAGQLILEAIRTNKLLSDPAPAKFLDPALQHVFAAVHQGHPKEDWLDWLCQVLNMIPMHPLNVRGKPKKLHRGKAKPRAVTRQDFAKTQLRGLKPKDLTALWRDFKRTH